MNSLINKKYCTSKRNLFLGIILSLQFSTVAQTYSLDSLLRVNSYSIDLKDGIYSGPGLKFLSDAAASSQFFNVCEEHNVAELNNLSLHLFELFQKK